eukprot:EC797117.1.p4 GENE.EC797117.1~~EC797117.1.p4  ORF type:complete len:54 (+),score=10.40 EC797117.1:313-474(+)
MIYRGQWNPDGTGKKPMPRHMREFRDQKRRETNYVFAVSSAIAVAFATVVMLI